MSHKTNYDSLVAAISVYLDNRGPCDIWLPNEEIKKRIEIDCDLIRLRSQILKMQKTIDLYGPAWEFALSQFKGLKDKGWDYEGLISEYLEDQKTKAPSHTDQ